MDNIAVPCFFDSHCIYDITGSNVVQCTAIHRVSDVTVICGNITISMLWGNTTYRWKLSGEDLSRYSIKIESETVHIITVLLRKWCHNTGNRHFLELAQHHGGKTAGIDMPCGMKKSRHRYPMYTGEWDRRNECPRKTCWDDVKGIQVWSVLEKMLTSAGRTIKEQPFSQENGH